jgi:hypothetical protein
MTICDEGVELSSDTLRFGVYHLFKIMARVIVVGAFNQIWARQNAT